MAESTSIARRRTSIADDLPTTLEKLLAGKHEWDSTPSIHLIFNTRMDTTHEYCNRD